MKNQISNEVKFIFSFMLRDKIKLILFLLLCCLGSFLNIIEPLFAKRIVDNAFNISNEWEMFYPALIWLLVFVAKSIVQYLGRIYNLKYKKNVIENLRVFFFNNLVKKHAQFFYKNPPAYLLSRFNSDIENLDGLMLTNLISGSVSVLEILIILYLMSNISTSLTIIAIFLKSIELYINIIFPLKKLYKDHNEALAVVDKETLNIFSCIKLVKVANRIKEETERYREKIKWFLEIRYKRDAINIIRDVISRFAIELSYPLVIIIGGLFIFYGWTTIGAVMAFLLYFQKLIPLFNNAAYMVPIFKISQASAERIYEFILSPNENISEISKKIEIKSIEFKNIKLTYAGKLVLNNFNMRLYNNKINALVGISGSGKSTIVNMLMGFITPDSGIILINGKPLKEYNIEDIRSSISLAFQDNVLFQRTIRENILYCCNVNESLQQELCEALRLTNSSNVFNKMEQGLDTMVLDNGNNLSGGEKQRLVLTRELLKKASVNIYDEATSALDSLSEQRIIKNLKTVNRFGIVLFITHKLLNVKDADIIYVLSNGTIVEYGTHDQLMDNKSHYYALYLEQSSENR